MPVELFLTDHSPDRPPVTIEVQTGTEPMLIETVDGGARTYPGEATDPDAVLSGRPQLVIGVLSGWLELAAAERRGLRYEGDPSVLSRVRAERVAPEQGAELVG
jgi:hypothetical protein